MEAIILAGGMGKRLQPLISTCPKPMALIQGRPFLTYVLDTLVRAGFSKIVMAVGYKKEFIQEYFGAVYKGTKIVYSIENTLLGTGGAIKQALTYCQEDDVFVLNGDTYCKVDFIAMYDFYKQVNADLVVVGVFMNNCSRYGFIKLEGENIIGFNEKKREYSGYINAGVYLLNKRLLNVMQEKEFSFEKDFLEKGVSKKSYCFFKNSGYFIDIGIPTDYIKACKILPYVEE